MRQSYRCQFFWFLTVLLVAPVLAYSSTSQPPVQPVETLRIGTSGDYPPFSVDGQGFDIVVAEQMATDFGAQIEWVPFSWPELSGKIRQNAFDVAMSGVTWRPERAVYGYMSRAVAVGGPCVVGDPLPKRVAVNRGGILETWTSANLPNALVVTTNDNLSLPQILAQGEADAFVTDSFEAQHMAKPGQRVTCQPPLDRKVYWVSPARAEDLGPRVDAWLVANEARMVELRTQYLGDSTTWTPIDNFADLMARRLSYMPAVAAWRQSQGIPIQDQAQEVRVLRATRKSATSRGLDPDAVEQLFALQIELAKQVQRGTPPDVRGIDLAVVRPELIRLADRQLDALIILQQDGGLLTTDDFALLAPFATTEQLHDLASQTNAVIKLSTRHTESAAGLKQLKGID